MPLHWRIPSIAITLLTILLSVRVWRSRTSYRPMFLAYLLFLVPFYAVRAYNPNLTRYLLIVLAAIHALVTLESMWLLHYLEAYRARARAAFGVGVALMMLAAALANGPYGYGNLPQWIYGVRLYTTLLCCGMMVGALTLLIPRPLPLIGWTLRHALLWTAYLGVTLWALSRPTLTMTDWVHADLWDMAVRSILLVAWL